MYKVDGGNSLRPQRSPERPGSVKPLNMGQEGAKRQMPSGLYFSHPAGFLLGRDPTPLGICCLLAPF